MYQQKIKILHLADLHLQKEFSLDTIVSGDFSIRREEIWRSFENAINFAASTGVEIVLLAGDNYENESMTISGLDRMAHIFSEYKDIQFFIIFGNHDCIGPKSEYLKDIVGDNVTVFGPELEYVEYKHIRVYGFSWDRLEYTEMPFGYPILDSEFFNILLLHCTVASSSNYLPIDPREMEIQGFDYLALGHIHTPGQVSENGYYAGSIEPMSFNNLENHGGYLLEVRGKSQKVSFIKFATRNYHIETIDISDALTSSMAKDLVEDRLKKALSHDYIKVILVGRKSQNINLNDLEMMLNDKYDHIRIEDNTKPDYDLYNLIDENKDNIIGRFLEEIDEKYDGREKKALIDIGIESMIVEDKLED